MVELKRLMRDDSGFTVVEYVIAAVVLFIVSTAVMGALAYAGTASASSNMRETALEIANQRMEQARNLAYDDVGTTDNYPAGDIVSPETVTVATGQGNKSFVVVTKVDYVLDYTNDTVYGEEASKSIRITVSWANPRAGNVTVESNIIGKSAITNAGTVIVNVRDSDTSAKVSGATITIKPATGAPASKTTGVDGFVRWGKVPSGSITITGTCPTHYLDFAPLAGGASVLAQSTPNEWTIQGIRASAGTVHVTDQNGASLPGVAVTISNPSLPAYSDWSCPTGTGTLVSDSSGNVYFPKLRKGTYAVSGVLSGYAQQATPAPGLVVVAGGGSYTQTLAMKKLTTILVTVTDASDNPISGATVAATGVTFASTTNSSGQVTSNDMGNIGTNKSYTVTVSKTGWMTNTGTVTLSSYTQGAVTIKLSPPPPTTIRVTVTDTGGVPIQGATASATGVVFGSTTDSNGQATSNDMGAIGTNVSYTVSVSKTGFTSKTGTVVLTQYTQGTLTIQLSPPTTTIKVTVKDSGGNPMSGVTVSATGPTTVTFPSVTDSNGQATSNNMGAIGTNKTYTVTVRKSGWAKNTGTVTLTQYNEGTVTVQLLKGNLEVWGYSTARTIYLYTSQTAGGSPSQTSATKASTSVAVYFYLPAGRYWVSRYATYGASSSSPKQVDVLDDGSMQSVTIASGN